MANIEVHRDSMMLARAVAEHIVRVAEAALTTQHRFTIALAGGSTPKLAYQILANEYGSLIDWGRTFVFFGDERCVPPDNKQSNYHMARDTLLDHVKLPMGNIYRLKGEDDPAQAANEYEEVLRQFFTGFRIEDDIVRPRFDLVLLGMGDDGHTASLFPGTTALHERDHWVTANYVEKLDAWRLTLTPVAINSASQVTFVVTGSGKAEAVRRVHSDETDPYEYPSKLIQPDDGAILWMLDKAAAAQL